MFSKDKEVVIDATINANGAEVKINNKLIGSDKKKKLGKVANLIDSCGICLCIVAYILLGTLCGLWHCAWILVFVPNFIASIVRAVAKKDLEQINVCFLACFAFFFVCLWVPGTSAHLWHPMWVVFLLIPVYYIMVHEIKNFNKD